MRNDTQVDFLFHDVCFNSSLKSYEKLYELLCSRLIHFSAGIVSSFQVAEEVVSDVFIMIWQKKHQLTTVKQPLLYIYVCTRNLSINKLSQHKGNNIPFDSLDKDALSMMPDIEQRIVSSDVAKIIERAIRELPGKCQLIFRLIKIDGLSYKETASLLDISPKTVDAQLAIAIKKLSATIRLHMPADLIASYFRN
ncbi:MAG: sigma-70 family RNA polymerase sigma factor [Agriterribacter sp.]